MESSTFEPMSIGQILDRTFKIYKDNFIRFITIVAIIQVPIALMTLVSMTFFQSAITQEMDAEIATFNENHTSVISEDGKEVSFEKTGDYEDAGTYKGPSPASMIIGVIGLFITVFLALIGQKMCQAALTKSVSEYYLGNSMTVGQAYKFVMPKLLTLIGAGIMVSLIVGVGFLLLIVPGVILGLWYALTMPAIITENVGASKGMARSKALASGNLGKIFSVGFLAIIIMWAISIPFSVVGSLLSGFVFTDNIILQTAIDQFFQVAGSILALPIASTAYILLYYDLRIRKEGFDLEMLAKTMGDDQEDANSNQFVA